MLWTAVTDEDGDHGTVGVPDHGDEHRLRAAQLVFDVIEPDWIGWSDHRDECAAAVAPLMKPCTLRQHVTAPWHEHEAGECGTEDEIDQAVTDGTEAETLACKREEGGCGCEDEGWICEEADGEPFPYLSVRRLEVDEALEAVRAAHLEDDDA